MVIGVVIWVSHIKTMEIARFPSDDGFLFNHVWGKTLRDGSSNLFDLRRHPNPFICPVRAIENYIIISQNIGVDLHHGYLFRPTSPQGSVLDKPFLSSAAESRLKFYLGQVKIDEGETLHSFRSGCTLTLAFPGSSRRGHYVPRGLEELRYSLPLYEAWRRCASWSPCRCAFVCFASSY